MPVRQLKIDRSFVTDMMQDQDNAMIVHSTVDLAHNLGLRTVAEGVESADVLNALHRMGCDIAQGYLISRPLPPEELLRFLRAGRWPVPRTGADNQGEIKVPGSY